MAAEFSSGDEYLPILNKIIREDDRIKFGHLNASNILLRKRTNDKPASWVARIYLAPSKFRDILGEYILYIMEIDDFTFSKIDEDAKEAVIYHELCHTFYDDEKGKYKLIGHDIEEFNDVFIKYGGFLPSRVQTINAIKKSLLNPEKKKKEVTESDLVSDLLGDDDNGGDDE